MVVSTVAPLQSPLLRVTVTFSKRVSPPSKVALLLASSQIVPVAIVTGAIGTISVGVSVSVGVGVSEGVRVNVGVSDGVGVQVEVWVGVRDGV